MSKDKKSVDQTNVKLKIKNLKTVLDNLLVKIERWRGDFGLFDIYNAVGKELANINISIVITSFHPTRQAVSPTFYYGTTEHRAWIEKYIKTKFNKIPRPLSELPEYQKALLTKQTLYYSIENMNTESNDSDKISARKPNAVITPLILRDEVIASFEFISGSLNQNHIVIFDYFAKNLSNNIANAILFQEMKKSRQRYKELWDDAPVAYHTLDPNGIITDVNKTEAAMLGYEKKEMIGQEIFDFIIPAQREEAKKRFAQKISGSNIEKKKNRLYQKKNGDTICVSIEDMIERDSAGMISGVRTTMINVSNQVQAEKKIEHANKAQNILNKLLQISLEDIPLNKMLDKIFNTLIAVPWIALQSKGGIWLSRDNPNTLVLTAHQGLPENLLINCSHIPYGKCHCGQAAQTGKLEFAGEICVRHTKSYPSIVPHGHYCVPIKLKDKVLGVMNFYLKIGHKYSKQEAEFLIAASNIVASIIERNQAKEALKQSEEKYRKLVDNAEDGVAIINTEGQIIFANQALQKILGFTSNKLAQLTIDKLIHPDDRAMVIKRYQDRLRGKKVASICEFRVIAKSGITKYISYSGTKIIEDGKITGIQAIVRDITENKKLQAKIEEAKRHYEQVIDTIQDGIVVINRQHKIMSCNRIFAEKTDLAIDKIKNKNCQEILPLYESRTLRNHCAKKIIERICGPKSVFKTGKAINVIEHCQDKRGQDHYHIVNIYPDKNKPGKIDQIVVGIRDITEQKMAEEEIRRLSEFNQRILNASPVSIVVLDTRGKIIAANALANKLMGKKNSAVVGRNLLQTKEIKNNSTLTKMYQVLLSRGEPFYYDNLSYGSEITDIQRYLNIIAVPLFSAGKKIEGAISMALDNTEAIRSKEKLEYLNQNLEYKVRQRTLELDKINQRLSEVLELKSKFISDASHELRTPLTIVQGNLDLAIREAQKKGNESSEIYELAIKEIENMGAILSDLTLLTNFDSKNEAINYERVNLGQLVRAVAMSLKVLADQKKIALIYKKSTPNVIIQGDEAKLEKLLLNIVRNAIKYTEPRGRVRLWLEKDQEEARIIVEDNGIGIPDSDQAFIFERFYRVDKARSRAEGGSGLGLSIAKWIANAHDGDIRVESEINQGSKFTIHLPRDGRLSSSSTKISS